MCADCGLAECCRLERTWGVWNDSVIWVTLHRDVGHNLGGSEAGGIEGGCGETFLPWSATLRR